MTFSRKFPALMAAFALAGGIAAGHCAGRISAGLLVACSVLLLAAALRPPPGPRRDAARLALVALVGAWRGGLTGAASAPPRPPVARLVAVEGFVETPPLRIVEHRNGEERVGTRFALRLRGLPASVRVRSFGPLPHLCAGDAVRVSGKLLPARGARNPGDHGGGGQAFLVVSHPQHVHRLHEPPRTPADVLRRTVARLRGAIARRIVSLYQPEARGLILSVILGDRRLLLEQSREALLYTGTYHLLAVSGLHVGLVMFIVLRIRFARRWEAPARLGLLLLFTLLTGANPPVVRAALVFTLHLVAKQSGRCGSPCNTLGAAALILLGWNPLLLFDVAFQFSFTAVLAILSWGMRLQQAAGRHRLLAALLVAVGASAGTSPLCAAYFHRVNPLGPLWNILATPLAALTLGGGIVSIGASLLWHPAGAVLAGGISVLVTGTMAVLDIASRLPASTMFLPPCGALPPLLSGLVLVAGLAPRSRRRFLWAGTLGLCLLCIQAVMAPRTARICVLDVGEGAAAVVSLPSGCAFLVDSGSTGNDAGAGRRLLARVVTNGNRALRGAFLTHLHEDHVRGVCGLCDRFPIGELWVSPFGRMTPRCRGIESAAALRGTSTRSVARGTSVRFSADPGFRVDILHPARSERLIPRDDENNLSLALRLQAPRGAVLFLGDLEEQGVIRLLASEANLVADVMVAPHHGRRNRFIDLLLEAVRPRVVVISGAGVPEARQLAARLEAAGTSVYATWRRGAVTIRWSARLGWTVAYWRDAGSGPRRRERPPPVQ